MPTPLSLQLARARRHHRLLSVFSCATAAIAQEAVATALKTGTPIVVFGSSLGVVRQSQKSEAAVTVLALAGGTESCSPDAWLIDLTEPEQTVPAGAETVLTFPYGTPPTLLSGPVNQMDPVALAVPSQGAPSLEQYREYLRALSAVVKLPLIVVGTVPTRQQYRSLPELGVAGYWMPEELNAAFTAGVRAILHDSSLNDPNRILGAGLAAVTDRLRNLLTTPHLPYA